MHKIGIVLVPFVTALVIVARELPARRLYLLAATPTVYRGVGYPATLYSIDARQRLRPERRIVSEDQGVEFVTVAGSSLGIGYPHATPRNLAFVHYDAPRSNDTVDFGTRVEGTPLESFVLREPAGEELVVLDWFAHNLASLSGIRASSAVGEERIIPRLSWSALQHIQFHGSVGGPNIGLAVTLPTLGSKGLYVLSPEGPAFIAPLTGAAPAGVDTPATMQAASPQFVVATRNVADPKTPNSKTLWVYDRQTGTAATIVVPGNTDRYRIFGGRLAVIVGYWGTGPGQAVGAETAASTYVVRSSAQSDTFDPGEELQRAEGTAELPPVRSFYKHPAMPQWFPGKLLVVDLRTQQIVEYEAGQADSEILYIEDQKVLFRVNDEIYSTQISGGRFDAPTLLVKDQDVPEIHWVFWGP